MQTFPYDNQYGIDPNTNLSFSGLGEPSLNPNWDSFSSGVPDLNFNWGARGTPISGQLQQELAPGFVSDVGGYAAPLNEAFSYTGDQFKNGNVMGGLNDLLGYGTDRLANTQLGQVVGNVADTGQELWGGLDAAGKFGTVFGGLQTLGGLYQGFKGMQMMKDQMAMQQDMWNKSWEANKKQFNESVESRAAGKYNSQASKTQRDEYQKKYSI